MVSSPELLFVEMAHSLGFHRALLLGLMLCAHPPGEAHRSLTTAEATRDFLQKIPGHHGLAQAKRVAYYLKDGAASAHEAILYMALTLPQRYGGYGLGGADFNHEIAVSAEYRRASGRKSFFSDLYWEKEKLAVEYDSRTFHENDEALARDAKKQMALKAMGYHAESVNTAQLYDVNALRVCAEVFAKTLGRRLRITNPRFDARHDALLSLLPGRGNGYG
ncbi:MAG: hypothetical protein LBR00_01945 [Clostridiales Family XIII bacterium]|jgi:very-short-patch-repair endonuclease|nr:hypothetical protein [Clostridiales Family XIII bacterium]